MTKKNILNDKSLRRIAITFIFWAEHDYNVLASFLSSLKVPCLVSPLHDQDINEMNCDTGEFEYKKPHYHVIIEIGTLKTVLQWFAILSPIRDFISIAPFDKISDKYKFEWTEFNSIQEVRDFSITNDVLKVWENENSIKNMRGLVRYFRHLDNPEKFQYGYDYHCFGGFDVDEVLLNKSDMMVISFQILDWINNNECYNFADLVDHARTHNIEWCQLFLKTSYCVYFTNYMKSAMFRNTGAYAKKFEKYERYVKDE